MTQPERTLEYRLTTVRAASFLCAALFAILGVSWTVADEGPTGLRVFAVAFTATSLLWMWRAYHANSAYSTNTGLEVYTLLKRYYVPWSEIARFEIGTGPVGVGGYRREVLAAVMRDGTRQEFSREINGKPSRDGATSPIAALAERLNSRLVER